MRQPDLLLFRLQRSHRTYVVLALPSVKSWWGLCLSRELVAPD